MSGVTKSHSPGYYIKRKLLRNRPAVAGMIVIIIAHLVAILGYLIMPDDSPNANMGALELKKQLPGTSIKFLKVRKNVQVEKHGGLGYYLSGQDSEYLYIPLDSLNTTESAVVAYVFGSRGSVVKEFSKIDVVADLYIGSDLSLGAEGQQWITDIKGVTYLNSKGETAKISSEDLETGLDANQITKSFVLGSDVAGRDVLSRLIFGTRISLLVGFIAVTLSLLIGITLGAIAGFFRGWVDNVVLWFMTVLWSVPRIMLVIAISLALGTKGIWVTFLAVGLTMWVEVARVVRGKILELREQQYVEAAKVLGVPNSRIIIRHILPNLMGSLIVIVTANFADAILLEAGLSFLGLGVQPPMPSWGQMVYEGFSHIGGSSSWHLILFPSLAISILVLAFNLFGNGLRDAFDPKTISD